MSAFSKKNDGTGLFTIQTQKDDPALSTLTELWPELKTLSLEHDNFDSAEAVVKAINEKMALYQSDQGWYQFVSSAFKAAGLPEFTKNELEAGTYTNLEIAEKFRNDKMRLVALLMHLPQSGGHASMRSVLSFAVENIESQKD